jgi:hypothetical protein
VGGGSTLALALVSSNQNTNLGAIAGYSEAGGCKIIGDKIAGLLSTGAAIKHFVPPLETEDDANHTKLRATMAQARTWLDQQKAAGRTTASVHIHTNAAGTPEAGTSHTGYCWSNDATTAQESKALGVAIAGRVAAVLGLPVQEYVYTDWLYDQILEPHPSVLIEVTRHDRRIDLERLYQTVDAVANAILAGALAWAGSGTSELDTLRRQLAEAQEQLARYKAAVQAVKTAVAAL